ncbi:unnamed protein product [Cuscuta campestris]|uniref:RNase H type-1 domain-containing protein n=1 Tax=Cuscuta campestris TaxID=132261 RepID=A0A484NHT0_9ASTE|nr:unnamed protein product [Cuscuta campestris]
MNATSAQMQATTEAVSIPMVASQPAFSAPTLPLGLSSIPTPSVVTPFTVPVPSAGPRVTFPPSMTQFMNDPANLQAIQGFGQVMVMCQQNGGMPFLPGMFPFALPGAGTMLLQTPMAVSPFQTPVPQPSPFQPQLVSAVAPNNLAGALNAAGQSRPPQGTNPQVTPDGHCVSVESGDGEWDIPRAHKKKKEKNIRPATSQNSAFERLGDREEGQRKSAKLRLGQSIAHVSAFARLGEGREAEPACTQRSWSNQQEPARTRVSRQEEEAESQPRGPVANRLAVPNDRVQQIEAKLERLEKKVGDSAAQRKNWVRSIYVGEVSDEPARRKLIRRERIVFTDRDLPPTGEDHNDPLVITMDINEVDVARTQLEPLKIPLSGFTRDTVEAEGSIVLPAELESGDKTVWKKMRFIVVDIKCVHNAILGRPGINRVGAVISMSHLCMKFHTPGGVGEVKGDQRNARECYARAVKKMTKGVNVISQEITKGETREKLDPEAETVEIELHPGDASRMVRIGANLPEDLKMEIARVLQEYAGIFAWSVADMPGIDRSVICHRLAVRKGSRPVRQKKRYLASDRRDFVRKEVSIKSDSSLIVGQVTGTMEAREGRMAQYKDLVLALLKGFEEFKIAQIPRAENADANLLSKLTQYAPEHVSKLARVEILDRASIEKIGCMI